MCDYLGHAFGAGYPDGVCIDGYLWDADSDDGDGFTCGGDRPCPRCNTAELLREARERALEGSCGQNNGMPWCAMTAWEAACAEALRENPAVAGPILERFGRLEIEDWPDRAAVYAGGAPWHRTEPRPWAYVDGGSAVDASSTRAQ